MKRRVIGGKVMQDGWTVERSAHQLIGQSAVKRR